MAPRPPRSFLLGLYLAVSRRAGGLARLWLDRRRRAGKEDGDRLGERMGIAGIARPKGPLVWFHAASVGEAVSLLELLRRLRDGRPDLVCLVTTGTVTSARLLAARLPAGCLHQFVPLDVVPWVERFLEHWRPDLAVWTESEFWPAMLVATRRRGVPMLLINARISLRSYRRWRRMRRLARALLSRFDRILAQDDLAATQLAALGADPDRLTVTGSLKEGAAPLGHDEEERVRIARLLAGRPVWLAASTHPGEEEIVLEAHACARRTLPMLALILAPRHPDRGEALAAMLRARGLATVRRGAGEALVPDTDVYLVDTLGEMGLWYRIAAVSFVGGSLNDAGGHNPFEPALLGSAILHGPHVRNFADGYARLRAAGAAVEVRSARDLCAALVATLAPDRAAAMAAAAWDAVSEGADVTDAVQRTIETALDGSRQDGDARGAGA
jgi:3-deoxy-D-manno-octulosonic-acid transferase